MALLAQIGVDPHTGEKRSAVRRSLRLQVDEVGSEGQSRALVRNLSETGLLLESATALSVGEELTVHLPEAGAVSARVIWARRPFFGCEFARPVGRAAVSAALLKSPSEDSSVGLTSPVDTTWLLSEPDPSTLVRENSKESTLALVLLGGVALAFVAALAALHLT